MKLLVTLSAFLLAFSFLAQDASGIIAEGSFFTRQNLDVASGSDMSDLDTIETNFIIAISETNHFIKISGIDDIIMNVIEFDSFKIDNYMETDYLASGLKNSHYITSKQLDFDLD